MYLLSYFSTIQSLKHTNLSSPRAPLLREIDMSAHWLFCTKCNSQLLFEHFLNIIVILAAFSPKLLKFHIGFICNLCYHIYIITFLCSFNTSLSKSHPLHKIANWKTRFCKLLSAPELLPYISLVPVNKYLAILTLQQY